MAVMRQEGGRQPPGLRSENHEETAGHRHPPIGLRAAFGQQHDLFVPRCHGFCELIKIIPDPKGYPGPVIQARPLDLTVRQSEPQRPDQMEHSAHAQTCSTDIAGVPMDFRGHQYDMAAAR